MASSHLIKSQKFRVSDSNPRTIAYVNLRTPFKSSKRPQGPGPLLQVDSWPQHQHFPRAPGNASICSRAVASRWVRSSTCSTHPVL